MNNCEKICWPYDCHPGIKEPISLATARLVEVLLTHQSQQDSVAENEIDGDSYQARKVAKGWINADDADLWGFLNKLFNKHPEWSDQQCKSLIQHWVKLRISRNEQAQFHKLWEQRWQKQHKKKLQDSLATTGKLTWAEACRFCEIWSVSRRIMPPFSGIASLLLVMTEINISNSTESLPEHSDRTVNKPVYDLTRSPKSANKQPKVYLIAPHSSVEEFTEFGSSRQLIWALKNSGLNWSLKQPWDDSIDLNPKTTLGVIFWSYRHRRNDYVHHAIAIENTCVSKNIPVMNSIINGWDTRHSSVLQKLKTSEVPCPQFQKFSRVEDIQLNYPLILRVDGLHRGQQMHLVKSAEEAKKLVNQKRSEFLASTKGPRIWPQPNLAVEFINVSDQHHKYEKRRAYVIGDQVLLRHLTISNHWLVNYASSDTIKESRKAHLAYLESGEEKQELILNAGYACGSEITALDYAKDQKGDYVFWEANRHFRMNGDKDYALPETVSDEKAKRRSAKDRKLGEALLTLLNERFGPSIENPNSIKSA